MELHQKELLASQEALRTQTEAVRSHADAKFLILKGQYETVDNHCRKLLKRVEQLEKRLKKDKFPSTPPYCPNSPDSSA